jgi:hypothetical protein
MIFVKNIGWLGNQMFCYAFAYAAARRLGVTFCHNHLQELACFELHGRNRFNNALQKLPFKFWKVMGRTPVQDWGSNETPPQLILDRVRDWTIYRGFFQSEDFFADYREEIRAAFTPRPFYRDEFRKLHGPLLASGKPLLVIHVRGGDYADWLFPKENVTDIRLPRLFFERALAGIPDWRNHTPVVVTDDPAYAASVVPGELNAPIVRKTQMADFQLLMAADTLVISNSSFAWWGAWLNPKPHKRIFAAKDWLGFKLGREVPARITTPDWNWISAV